MRQINEYIIEKLRINKNIEFKNSYVCFIGEISDLKYKVFSDKESLIEFIKSTKNDWVRYVARVKENYVDEMIEKEKERIDSISKSSNKINDIERINKVLDDWMESIGGISFANYNINELIEQIEKD